jgi:hypothetical protein
MSSFALLSLGALVPAAFALPVPQAIGTGLMDSYGWPAGAATLGGLSSSITTEGGGYSSAGPPKSGGYGLGNNNGGYPYPRPSNNNGFGWQNNNNNGEYGWGYPRGGETSTTVTTSGPGITTPYNKRSADVPSSDGERFAGYTKGRDGQPRPGLTNGRGPITGLSHPPPSSASLGSLTSSITLEGHSHSKRQIATDLGGDGIEGQNEAGQISIPLGGGAFAALSGLESGLTLEG